MNYNPAIIRGAALLAILFSFLSKFGVILRTIPESVIGGVSIVLFGMIASVGIRTLVNEKVDLTNSKNLSIVSLMLILGLGGASIKFGNVEFQGVALAAIIGLIANIIIPNKNKN